MLFQSWGVTSTEQKAMQCFRFASWEKEREKENLQGPGRSQSARSNSSMSTDHDARRSGSECCSLNMSSEMSVESFGRYRQLSLPQRSNNLRIFTFQELKSATRNFSRTLMIGEGGFGCVYRGTIRSVLEPRRSQDVAIKQLGRKGLQVPFSSPYALSRSFKQQHNIVSDLTNHQPEQSSGIWQWMAECM
jgi:hypothetical protein